MLSIVQGALSDDRLARTGSEPASEDRALRLNQQKNEEKASS